MKDDIILQVENLHTGFLVDNVPLEAVSGVSFSLKAGRVLGVVGESGCGKSVTAHSIMQLLPKYGRITEGSITYTRATGEKIEIQKLRRTGNQMRQIRGKEISMIFQEPMSSLNPVITVGDQIMENILTHEEVSKEEAKQRAIDLLAEVGISRPEKVVDNYPFQLSGGMARKVLLSTALASDSKVIIADEPTPGLDEESLNEVLKDFRDIADSGRAILMITHDIMAALKIADKVAIFYAGSTLEIANTSDFKQKEVELRHPYTKALYKALPNHDFVPIDDKTQPLPNELPKGCVFSDRCPLKDKNCENQVPKIREIRNGKVRCIHAT